MTTTSLPPLASDGVFVAAASSEIDASIDKVWDILTDFKSYKEWNSFVRGQTVLDSKTNKPLDERLSHAGQHMYIYPVHIPPTMGKASMFQVSGVNVVCNAFDPENYRVAWQTTGWTPKWLFFAERWQWLVHLGDGKTKYETMEVFSGPVAYLVQFFVGANLLLSVKAMADDLKRWAEKS